MDVPSSSKAASSSPPTPLPSHILSLSINLCPTSKAPAFSGISYQSPNLTASQVGRVSKGSLPSLISPLWTRERGRRVQSGGQDGMDGGWQENFSLGFAERGLLLKSHLESQTHTLRISFWLKILPLST